MDSIIVSLISGHLFSKGADAGQGRFQRYMKRKDLSRILDDYNDAFIHHYNVEISLNNCDMGAVFEKRAFLISCAKEHFKKDNSDIRNNLKQEFISTACKEIGDSSETVKTYLDTFFLLVFTKETQKVSAGYRALLNAYADSQHEINKKTDEKFLRQDEKIGRINKALEEIQNVKKAPVDFRLYYQIVEENFTEEKEEESIVGKESDENAYIDAYIENESESVPVLSFLEGWFAEKKSGAILIYGEPGHGKTMLCNKAIVEFSGGKFLKGKAKNVIAVSLNTGDNPSIIQDRGIIFSNALAWGAEQENRFSFEDCRGSLLFMDGFDEFIDDAKRVGSGVDNICFFMKRIKDIAKNYGVHIVVLSRTSAVSAFLENLSGVCKHYGLLPVTEKQQDDWMEKHPEYTDYRENFQYVREDTNMQELLGVPLLFRLIVYNRFENVSPNVVKLYDNLFIHLMNKRNIYEDIPLAEKNLMNLAYEVYCTDTNIAVLENFPGDPHWLFTFYVKTTGKGIIGFFHRTFYQYFFAKFIYSGIKDIVTDEDAEVFIGLFAERDLDFTVCEYLSLMIVEEDKPKVYFNIEMLINALSRTEACLNHKPHIDSGNAEKSRILRTENIYRNVLRFAFAFSYVIQVPFKGNLEILVRTFNSAGISLFSKKDKRANLRSANLIGSALSRANLSKADLSKAVLDDADLRRADLSGANLNKATLFGTTLSRANLIGTTLIGAIFIFVDLNRVNLRGANLHGAILRDSDLIEANLRGANLHGAILEKSDLRGADLREADLREASLCGSDLIGADLRGADLRGADLSGTYLREANLSGAILFQTKIDLKDKDIIDISSEYYDSIEWISEEEWISDESDKE